MKALTNLILCVVAIFAFGCEFQSNDPTLKHLKPEQQRAVANLSPEARSVWDMMQTLKKQTSLKPGQLIQMRQFVEGKTFQQRAYLGPVLLVCLENELMTSGDARQWVSQVRLRSDSTEEQQGWDHFLKRIDAHEQRLKEKRAKEETLSAEDRKELKEVSQQNLAVMKEIQAHKAISEKNRKHMETLRDSDKVGIRLSLSPVLMTAVQSGAMSKAEAKQWIASASQRSQSESENQAWKNLEKSIDKLNNP
ncbi:MAG TPA: hypothetical protein PLO61_06730 [Fimbriimonadaceae bacterium]|nr:hypothetical protein [Fimbriimonadaceae bacterium]HRJ33212.1 hypothetical protein [Fimbriimonadaceae bacterium]